MYAETGLLFPCFQNFSPEIHHLDDFYQLHQKPNPNSNLNNLGHSTIAEYDLGAEGDLFKAPEPIIQEPDMGLDPMAAAIAMINSGEEAITPQDHQPLLSDAFYQCRKDLLAKAAIHLPQSELPPFDVKISLTPIDENCDVLLQKSVSSGCLSSMEWKQGTELTPNCLMDFSSSAVDFGAAFRMRRAFSEGDIKTLGSGNTSHLHPLLLQPPVSVINCAAEQRKEKLSRYRNKKVKRNFGRKIKYACRKALADNQPRIRGRFAKTEETDNLKPEPDIIN